MDQRAVDQIKTERDAAVRERDAMAQEIERLKTELQFIANHDFGGADDFSIAMIAKLILHRARAALKESKNV